MNLKYLQQFLELSKCVSMSQFAAKTEVTHAQVSRMVMELEKEFGYQLLIRDKSRTNIKLTKKGEVLVKRIPFVFNEISVMKSFVHSDEETELGNFDLYTTTYLIDYWIAPHLHEFKIKYPNITLNLFGREDAPGHEEKRTTFTISPKTEETEEVTQVFMQNFHIGLWASQEYLKNHGCPQHVSDLSNHMIICFERSWPERAYPTMNWYMNNTNFRLKQENVIIIRSSVGIMKAADAGLGIFSLSQESIDTFGMSFQRILPELEGPVVPMCFSYPTAWKHHKSIQIIENFLQNIFKGKI
ncbi:MAG: LysR family transcriptional regulator [Nitrosopumilus sp.]|nr:LysR family transcriptional regulator [Nitrosopumilus sp.]